MDAESENKNIQEKNSKQTTVKNVATRQEKTATITTHQQHEQEQQNCRDIANLYYNRTKRNNLMFEPLQQKEQNRNRKINRIDKYCSFEYNISGDDCGGNGDSCVRFFIFMASANRKVLDFPLILTKKTLIAE